MTENLKQFLLAVASDAEWTQLVGAMAGKEDAVNAALQKAAELGLPLSAEDFELSEELSEEELAGVSGGGCTCSGAGMGSVDFDPADLLSSDEVSSSVAYELTVGCFCILQGAGR